MLYFNNWNSYTLKQHIICYFKHLHFFPIYYVISFSVKNESKWKPYECTMSYRVKEQSLAQDINNLLNHLSHFIHLAFF